MRVAQCARNAKRNAPATHDTGRGAAFQQRMRTFDSWLYVACTDSPNAMLKSQDSTRSFRFLMVPTWKRGTARTAAHHGTTGMGVRRTTRDRAGPSVKGVHTEACVCRTAGRAVGCSAPLKATAPIPARLCPRCCCGGGGGGQRKGGDRIATALTFVGLSPTAAFRSHQGPPPHGLV